MNNYIQVITTISDKPGAEKIANALIEKKLAACVQMLGPVKSIYRWKEKVETAKEFMCVIKTRKTLYKKVEKQIKEIHPYEVPEIIAVSIVKGSRDYLKWLSKETIKNNG